MTTPDEGLADEAVRLPVDAGADLDGGTPTGRATAEMPGLQDLLP